MARRLIEKGHQVTIVCGSYGMGRTGLTEEFQSGMRRGAVDGIDVLELQLPYDNTQGFLKRSLVFFKFALKSVWIALTGSYDVIFATSTPLTAAIPGIFARVLRRKPFVFEVRDLWPELPKAMGVITNPLILVPLGWLEWLAYRVATSCIGLSPGIVKGIQSRSPANRCVAMIPNGCDLELFSPSTKRVQYFERSSKNELVAVFTGAHGLANGLDAVVDAASELKKRGRKDIRIVLIGDGMEKSRLRTLSEERELPNIEFIDPVPKTRLPEILRDADVGLMILANVPAFYYGTSPNKFFDYIALGLPVLNNYPGWLADMIGEAGIGIAVKPANSEEFADALIYLAENPDERVRMGVNARKFAEDNFGRKALADAFVLQLERAAS
jgi:glycosyltransferase involved in cell wall biosynthesis